MKFNTIIADPPWSYPNKTLWQRQSSVPENHYPTMTLEEILDLGDLIRDVSDPKSCALFLWIPTFHLIRGYGVEVVERWGFRPMTTIVWAKDRMGLGHYLRNAHEQALLAVRGKYQLKVKDQWSYFVAPRTKHSVKPAIFHDIVERCCHGPYLEMFARRKGRPNWTYVGNETSGGDIRDDLRALIDG